MALVFIHDLSKEVFHMGTTRQKVEKAFSRMAGMLKRLAKYVEEIGKEGEVIRSIKKSTTNKSHSCTKKGRGRSVRMKKGGKNCLMICFVSRFPTGKDS